MQFLCKANSSPLERVTKGGLLASHMFDGTSSGSTQQGKKNGNREGQFLVPKCVGVHDVCIPQNGRTAILLLRENSEARLVTRLRVCVHVCMPVCKCVCAHVHIHMRMYMAYGSQRTSSGGGVPHIPSR